MCFHEARGPRDGSEWFVLVQGGSGWFRDVQLVQDVSSGVMVCAQVLGSLGMESLRVSGQCWSGLGGFRVCGEFRRGRLEEGGDGGDGGGKRKGWASGLRRGTLRWFGVVVWAGRSREEEGVTILEVWLGPVGADQEVSGRLRARVRKGSVWS